MTENLPLIADGNSRLEKSIRARKQPRDKRGRWVPYGAKVVAGLRLPDGSTVNVEGVSAGGTATADNQLNKIRLYVEKGNPAWGIADNTILEIDPKNGELQTGVKLDRKYLEKHGIDPDSKADLPEDLADMPQMINEMNPKPASDLDKRLAKGLSEKEDAELRKERDKEPVAKLAPAVAAKALEGEDVKDLLDSKKRIGGPKPGEKSVPDDMTPPKEGRSELPTPPKTPGKEEPKPLGKPPRFPGDKGVPEPTDVSDKPKPPSITPEKKPLGKPPTSPGDKPVPTPTDVSDKPRPLSLKQKMAFDAVKKLMKSKGAKKSKMKRPALVRFTKSDEKRYPTGQGDIVVPGMSNSTFAYVDEDGNRRGIMVTRLSNGTLEISTGPGGIDVSARQTKDGKWELIDSPNGVSPEVLGEFDNKEAAQDALIRAVNDELGFDPTQIFGGGAGATALRKKNENPKTKVKSDYIDMSPKSSEEMIELNELLKEKPEKSKDTPVDLQGPLVVPPWSEPDPFNRPMPFGRAWTDPATGKVYKPVIPGTDDYQKIAIQDIFHEVNRGGDAPDIDQLVDKAKAPSSKPINPADVKPGDVIKDKQGVEWTVLAKPKLDPLDNSKVELALEDANGNRKSVPFSMANKIMVEPKKQAPKAATPKAPDATPTPDATPDAKPTTPKKVAKPAAKPPKPKPNTPKKPPTIPAGRKDDGKDIAPNPRPLGDMQAVPIEQLVDQDGKPLFGKGRKKIEDPNAIYNAILEYNPQAKIDESGHIILERADFTDKDGKVYKYEVAVARTHGNKYMERYRFTDENGDTQEFYHYDYKDSFASIYGDKNGVYTFRDHMLGRTSPEAPIRKNGEENRVYKAFWADDKPLEARIRYFRGNRAKGREEPTPQELNATGQQAVKLLTPEEVVNKYLEGSPEVYNKSGQARGTKLKSFSGNAWDALENDDTPAFEAVLQQLLGRLPDNEASRELLISTLRDGIKDKFNGTPLGRKMSPLANNIYKKILTEGWDIRDLQRRPFSAKDGKTIVTPGAKVRYWNNVGEWSIGEVVAQSSPKTSGKGVYDDAVVVRFANGRLALLRSNRMDVLGDDLDTDLNQHDKDSDVTSFKENLKGQALRDERGYAYDFGDEERQAEENADLQPDEVGSTADPDAAAPYLGEQGVDADLPEAGNTAGPEGNIGDFESGDVWPDENGDRKGIFIEAQKVSDPDTGEEAWAVIWEDDDENEQLDLIPIGESRSPK